MARNRTVNPKLNLWPNPRLNHHGLATLPPMGYRVGVHAATRLAPLNLGESVDNPNRTPLALAWLLPASKWTPVPSIWSCLGARMRRHLQFDKLKHEHQDMIISKSIPHKPLQYIPFGFLYPEAFFILFHEGAIELLAGEIDIKYKNF